VHGWERADSLAAVRSDEAPERLVTLLEQAGVDLQSPNAQDVETTWTVMAQFAAEHVEDVAADNPDSDAILAQYGRYGPRRSVTLDMTRQFIFHDEDGEYSHMAQLSCQFTFKATRALRAVPEANLWSFELSLKDFFDRALAMPGFVAVRDGALTPRALSVSYGDV